MIWMKGHWRIICWPVAVALAAAAGWWAAVDPGDRYWIGGLPAIPALVLGMLEMEQAWPSMSRTRKLLLVAITLACATAGMIYSIASPGARSYLIAGLLSSPLMIVLMPILMRDDEDDEHYPAATEGPWGPPAL